MAHVEKALAESLILIGDYDRVKMHMDLVTALNDLYKRKNHDYGNSFAKQRLRDSNSILIRLYDKYLRLEQLLTTQEEAQVKDESIEDTFLDLANYCLMEVVERRISALASKEAADVCSLWYTG